MKKSYQTPETRGIEMNMDSALLTTSLPVSEQQTIKMLSPERGDNFDEEE